MSDSVENADYDVEAQESLLVNHPAEEEEATFDARKTLKRFILLIRSIEHFKSGANYAAADITSSSTASAAYASITGSDEILITRPHEGSGIVPAPEAPVDSTEEIILNAHPASDSYEHAIELQQIQRKNITEIVRTKNLHELHNFGGVRGVEEALNSDLEKESNSSPQEICQCKPSQLSKSLRTFFRSFLGSCNNYTVFLLSCAAALSLVFGIEEDGWDMGWFNGGVLVVTIFVIVIGTTVHRCWEELSCSKLENSWLSKGRKTQVRVVRGNEIHFVLEIDLRVGDVVALQKGDQVPADGIFKRSAGDQALELDDALIVSTTIDEKNPLSTTIEEKNPFLFYGSRVINGNARMLVTSTPMDTVWGEMMSQAMETSAENECKLECYLHKLNTCVQIAGLLISILIIVVLFLRYKLGKLDDERRYRPDSKGEPTPVRMITDAIKGIITGSKGTARVLTTLLSVSLLGIMEGIPFAISVAAIIWSSKTPAHKAFQRDYLACLKMARVTTIISDKFGGMVEHGMEIDKFYVGEGFVSESSVVASEVLEGLCDGIGALFLIPPEDREPKLQPLISWAEQKLGMRESMIKQYTMIEYSGCNPLEEPCQVLMEKNGEGRKYLHCIGPPQQILSMCSHHYDIDGHKHGIDGDKRINFEKVGSKLVEEGEVVIAYACKQVTDVTDGSVETKDLTFLGMISMRETNTEDTKRAVSTLKEAGIRTVLASGDDISVLETIGLKCGLITHDHGSDDLVVKAEDFRNWADDVRTENVEKICILGNCIPSDKILLIKCLKEKKQEVALLAQRTVDAPALKHADIGVTYGTWSSEVARECCNISIWEGDCLSLMANIIENGRCFQENIRKFIQLELILAISSSLINFAAVVFWGDAPITAVQLFWLNLVVGLVGGLALLIGPSTTKLMTPVYRSSARLITKHMCRNIAIQVSYQTTMFVTLQHKGQAILGTSGDRVKSVIYNGLFLSQMFNKFIARQPEQKNIFSGLLHNNCWFWVALVLFIICQAVFALAEEALSCSPRLGLKLWGACVLIGLVSWLLDFAGKVASYFTARWAADDRSGGNRTLNWTHSITLNRAFQSA